MERALAASVWVVIAVGTYYRWFRLGARGFTRDELYSAISASTSPNLLALYQDWVTSDTHPPLYYSLLHLWFKVAPVTEWWTRMPSALASTATLVYAWVATRQVLGPVPRALLVALLATSYNLLFYAQEARPYSFLVLMMLISMHRWLVLLDRLREGQPRRRDWALFAVASLLLGYFHYYGFLTALAMHGGLGLVVLLGRKPWRGWLAGLMVLLVGYLPVYKLVYDVTRTGWGFWQPRYPWGSFWISYTERALFLDSWPTWSYLAGLGALAVIGLVLGRLLHGRWPSGSWHPTRPLPAITLLMVVLVAALVVMYQFSPSLQDRYLLILAPPLFVWLGLVLERVGHGLPRLAIAAAVLVTLWGMSGYMDYYQKTVKQGWREAVAWVGRLPAMPDRRLVILGPRGDKTALQYMQEAAVDDYFYVRNHAFFDYYFRAQGFDELADGLERCPNTAADVLAVLDQATAAGDREVIFLGGHHLKIDKPALAEIEAHGYRHQYKTYKSTRIYRFNLSSKR